MQILFILRPSNEMKNNKFNKVENSPALWPAPTVARSRAHVVIAQVNKKIIINFLNLD